MHIPLFKEEDNPLELSIPVKNGDHFQETLRMETMRSEFTQGVVLLTLDFKQEFYLKLQTGENSTAKKTKELTEQTQPLIQTERDARQSQHSTQV
jgi:hypothetical protein